MRIAIIGGGNIGTLMGAEFAARGHEVRMCASDPEKWRDDIDVFDPSGSVLMHGRLYLVTSNLHAAIEGADIVWVTYPSFLLDRIAAELLPLMQPSQWLGVVPGNLAEFAFHGHVENGGVLFGLQRVHSVARLGERGKSVYMLGRRESGLHVAAIPSAMVEPVADTLASLFELPVEVLPTYLVETLTPSNPILHTARIRSMFRGWKPGMTYDHNILFYEEWDDASSGLMLECDAELQLLCRNLERELGCDLSGVKSLREHYESPDAPSMTRKIASIPGFRGLTSPMREVSPGRWEPDFSSRYFLADFPYGLKAIRDIGVLANVPTPAMDEVYGWYRSVAGNTPEFSGLPNSLEGLRHIYS